jgi:RimJ/RimL family protein N-acetyltransferase
VTSLWEGRLVRLRAVEPADIDAFVAADADTDGAQAGWRVFAPRPLWAAEEWVAQAGRSANDGDEVRLAIESLAASEVVGTINTHTCDISAGTFSYGVAVFPWHRRQGYGSDAVVVMLRYLFGERRYQKCTIGVYEFNDVSIAMHLSLGFREEGRIRRAHYAAGRHWDEVVLGLTVEEYADRWPFRSP